MPTQTFARAACISTVLALSACGGGDGGGICQAIGGGISSTVIDGTTLSEREKASDRDLASAAVAQPNLAGTGGVTLRASPGNSQGSSGTAGVLLARAQSGQTVQVTITTYLQGVAQDSNTAGTDLGGNNGSTCPGTCVQDGSGATYFGIPVSRAYDAIETTLRFSGTSAPVRVLELCKR